MTKLKHHDVCVHRAATREDLQNLARVQDVGGHAVSFYFKPGPGSLVQRDAMIVNLRVRDIISNSFMGEKPSGGLIRDLDDVLQLSEEHTGDQPLLKVVFACRNQGVWEEFELPSSVIRMVRLEVGKQFDLAPLMRLMQTDELKSSAR